MSPPRQGALVTGGAGFIGSHLVDELVRRGLAVRVYDDLSTGTLANLQGALATGRVEFVRGDVRDREGLRAAVAGVGLVFHLACRGVRHSLGRPQESHEVNATGTLVAVQEAHRAGVGAFVHVSSSEVYGTARRVPMGEDHPCLPETVYGAAKLAGEGYARAYHRTYGLPVVVARPFNNFGPRGHVAGDAGEVIPRFCARALAGLPPVVFGDGTQTRDFLYVGDTARGLYRLALAGAATGRTVNLGTGRETSVADLARLVYGLAGRPDLLPAFQPPRPGDVDRHLADARLAADLVGFSPAVGLAEGIKLLLEDLGSRPEGVERLAAAAPDRNWHVAA